MRPATLALFASVLAAAPAAADGPPPGAAPPGAAAPLPTYFELPTAATEAPADLVATAATPGTRPTAWVSADYLMWFLSGQNSPSLVQAVPSGLAGTGAAIPPVTNQRVYPLSDDIEFGLYNGIRLSGGFQLNDRLAVDASGFWSEKQTNGTDVYSTGAPYAVALNYVSAGTGGPSVLYVSRPGLYAGGTSVRANSDFGGADINLRCGWCNELNDRRGFSAGFRYFELGEGLQLESRTFFPSGTVLGIADVFQTRNQYYAGQVGAYSRIGATNRGLGLDTQMKFGMGGVNQQVNAFGSNTYLAPGMAPSTEAGGLYARGLNFGSFDRTVYAVHFDLNLNLTYNFTRGCQVQLGYSLFYMSNVVRPGDQIDPVVNDSTARFVTAPTTSPLARPAFRWVDSDLFVQGVSLGMTLAY